ncbi:phosphate acyltransferase [Prolixibacteraceae bacterium]|nr:phosphate acyltransferase [Prolixibacteraceae bacterium]
MKNTSLDTLIEVAQKGEVRRLVIMHAMDHHTLEAAYIAKQKNVCDILLTGDKSVIEDICSKHGYDSSVFKIFSTNSLEESIVTTVGLLKNKEADFVMKGSLTTDQYMRAILAKDACLFDRGSILSHVSAISIPSFDRLLIVSDVAIIPLPTIGNKIQMVEYQKQIFERIGVKDPKIGIITPSEVVSKKIVSSTDAVEVKEHFKDDNSVIVEGPISLDLALDKEAVLEKGYDSPAAGECNGLIFANLEAGNVFYKSATKLMNAETAAIVMGAHIPIVLTSRGDSVQCKINSIAMGAILSN